MGRWKCECEITTQNIWQLGGLPEKRYCGEPAVSLVHDNDSDDIMPLCSDHLEKFRELNGDAFQISEIKENKDGNS